MTFYRFMAAVIITADLWQLPLQQLITFGRFMAAIITTADHFWLIYGSDHLIADNYLYIYTSVITTAEQCW